MSKILTWAHRDGFVKGGIEGYIQTPAPVASNNAPRVSKVASRFVWLQRGKKVTSDHPASYSRTDVISQTPAPVSFNHV